MVLNVYISKDNSVKFWFMNFEALKKDTNKLIF